MKKLVLISILAMSSALFAHSQYLYTDKLNVSNEKSINVKLLFGHPGEGKEAGGINVATVDGKEHGPEKLVVVHNGETTDLISKVRDAKLKTDVNVSRIFEFDYGIEDGLVGKGSFVFLLSPGRATDVGYGFNNLSKLVITKDGGGSDWHKRLADGYAEIIPMVNPTKAWKESGFIAQVVDANGNPVEGSRVDASIINAKIDMANNVYAGGEEIEKNEYQIYTGPNGMFHFIPPKEGKWVMRASMPRANGVKEVFDTSLLVEFK